MKKEVLKLLKESDGFLSGQSICDELSVSRTAVWKVIHQLKEEGYQIEAVRNKGYYLAETADVITEAELLCCIKGSWCGHNIYYYRETDSTNVRAKYLAEEGAVHGSLVIADAQSCGRGRRGRAWVTDPGTGIWMSLILKPEFSPTTASMLTLIAALAVRRGIRESTGIKLEIKWPNDLTYKGRKLCGILTEMSAEMDHIHYVVVGIGINVNTSEFPKELSDKAGSLKLISGTGYKRSLIVGEILKEFESYYQRFLESGDLSPFVEEYHTYLTGYLEPIKVLHGNREYEGIELGIVPSGELKLRLEDGKETTISSGEVSIRTEAGYL